MLKIMHPFAQHFNTGQYLSKMWFMLILKVTAYLYPGLITIRHKGDGRLPVPGWSGEYEWDGYIPFDELPHLLNPPPGYIATANNRVVGNGYPYILGSDVVTGNRAQRIDEMINAQEKINLKYIQTMQTDWVSTAARRTNKHICNLQTSDPELENVLRRMRNWDGNLGQQNPEGSVYQVFCIKFLNLILEPRLGKDLTGCLVRIEAGRSGM